MLKRHARPATHGHLLELAFEEIETHELFLLRDAQEKGRHPLHRGDGNGLYVNVAKG